MRFLADENVEAAVVDALRREGHNVLEVGEAHPGLDDEGVVRLARREDRVLITNDKDFGELIVLQGRRIPGMLLLRLPGFAGRAKARVVLSALRPPRLRLIGRIVVVERGRVRSRPLRTD